MFENKGRESVEFMEVHVVAGATEGASDETSARKTLDVSGLEIDSIFLNEEVWDPSGVLLEAIGALRLGEGVVAWRAGLMI
jgi:hypothetical protein